MAYSTVTLDPYAEHMKRIAVITAAIMLAGCTATAIPPAELSGWDEKWQCSASLSELGPITLVGMREVGMVWFEGQRYETAFLAEGLHRRWNWCAVEGEEVSGADPDRTYYNCAFVIRPDGMGFYFDFKDAEFGEDKTSSGTFRCRRLRA